jgi:small subunit ribosomal protein S4
MARYTGPRSRIARKFKEPIFGPDKVLEKKAYPPGMHGVGKKRGGRKSEYSEQLSEKQKAKYTYGILERQFRKTFAKAASTKGKTGELLLQLVESRLDNVVYRMGIAPTRAGARQLVGHNHILVNGKVLNIPSYNVKPGTKISVRERSKSLEAISNAVAQSNTAAYPWIEFNAHALEGTYVSIPTRDQIPENIKEQLIVELYSK